MLRTPLVLALMLVAMGALPAVHASGLSTISCSATLSGSSEVPPNASTATGLADFTFDTGTGFSTWSVTFSGLVAPAVASHVHAPALPGSNAAVVLALTTVPAATSGSFSGFATIAFPTLTEASASSFATDLLAGKAYVNIHDSSFPGGEVRGQLSCTQPSSVPEFPFGYALLFALALPALLVLKRRIDSPGSLNP